MPWPSPAGGESSEETVFAVCSSCSAAHRWSITKREAGRVRELSRSSRLQFRMVWHQFNTVQFPSHHFVWEVCSIQFGVRGPGGCVQFVEFSSFSSVHELSGLRLGKF